MYIRAEDLTYQYKNGRGIKGVSFCVESGDILAVVGCNGAGKTTLLKVLAGLLTAVKGKVEIKGGKKDSLNNVISFLISDNVLIDHMTVLQMINYVNIMKEINLSNEEIEYKLETFFLTEYKKMKISTLSTGTKKRLSIFLTFLSNSDIILFDEPTNGLDTKSVILFKNLLREYSENGKIIIITSHILDFVQSIANKALIIDGGEQESEIVCLNNVTLEELYIRKEQPLK